MSYVNNVTWKKNRGENNEGISMTVPDQALPLATLIERHVRGQDVTIFKGIYSMKNDEDFANILPEIDKMDKIQRLVYSQKLKRQVEFLRNQKGVNVGVETEVNAAELIEAAEDIKEAEDKA